MVKRHIINAANAYNPRLSKNPRLTKETLQKIDLESQKEPNQPDLDKHDENGNHIEGEGDDITLNSIETPEHISEKEPSRPPSPQRPDLEDNQVNEEKQPEVKDKQYEESVKSTARERIKERARSLLNKINSKPVIKFFLNLYRRRSFRLEKH